MSRYPRSIRSFLLFILGAALLSPLTGFADTPKAAQPVPVEQEWWKNRHDKKAQDTGRKKKAQLVMIGDSITQKWEAAYKIWNQYYAPYGAVNLGYSSDRTEHVLWRLQNGEIDGMSPKVAVLLIGTNNTGHRQDPAQETAAGIRAILDVLREKLPETKILLLGIFPRGETPDNPRRMLNEEINAIIAKFADNKHIYYLNINDTFLQEDGTISKTIMPDLLHLSEAGYQLWADAMKPALSQLMGE